MATEIVLTEDIVEQIKARASSVASTASNAAKRSGADLEETVRLHVINALTEAVYNTVRLDANYLEVSDDHSRAAALRSGESLRNQKLLSAPNSE